MNRQTWTASGLALILCSCASTPPQTSVSIDSARSAVQAAEADPNVPKYASLDLEAAKKNLSDAEAAAGKHDQSTSLQSAYLAAQTARLAQLRAATKADEARVASGQAERDKIVLAQRAKEADASKAKAAQLQSEIDALKAKPTDRGLVLTLGDVLFSTGKADLNPGGVQKINQLASFLKEHNDRRVEIDGYTDSTGSDSTNLDLSQRRANAVQASLVSQGIDASRITTHGYGKEFPVASNANSGGRQLNRRVEVVIGGENGQEIASRSSP